MKELKGNEEEWDRLQWGSLLHGLAEDKRNQWNETEDNG